MHIKAAVREPRMACRFIGAVLRRDYEFATKTKQEYVIKQTFIRLFPVHSVRLADPFIREILNSRFHDNMQRRLQSDEHVRSLQQGRPIKDAAVLYVICRVLRPEFVIETGVGPGVSTAYMLKALEDNSLGHLYSIDMPGREQELRRSDKNYTGVISEPVASLQQSGWLVPESMRHRWTLRLGLSHDVLPRLLQELDEADVFLHDSEHSYENMLFEYKCVWPYLRAGGGLISHDINWNSAFTDFALEVKHKPTTVGNLGAIIK